MRKLLLLCACLYVVNSSNAQSFSTVVDTFYGYIPASNSGEFHNDIINHTSVNMTLYWKVLAHDFPADWVAGTSICDNLACRPNSISFSTDFKSCVYLPSDTGLFDLTVDFSSASLGTHWLTVHDSTGPSSVLNSTFIIKKPALGVTTVTATNDAVVLYPNPVTNQLNVVFADEADVKTITICNVIGKVTNVYKVTGRSAGLELGNLPGGVYFVRLFNSQGGIVATRKFNKL